MSERGDRRRAATRPTCSGSVSWTPRPRRTPAPPGIETFKELCPSCGIAETEFTTREHRQAATSISAALVSNPDTNAIIVPVDSYVPPVLQGIQSARFADKVKVYSSSSRPRRAPAGQGRPAGDRPRHPGALRGLEVRQRHGPAHGRPGGREGRRTSSPAPSPPATSVSSPSTTRATSPPTGSAATATSRSSSPPGASSNHGHGDEAGGPQRLQDVRLDDGAPRGRPRGRARRDPRPHRPERLRQVHPREDPHGLPRAGCRCLAHRGRAGPRPARPVGRGVGGRGLRGPPGPRPARPAVVSREHRHRRLRRTTGSRRKIDWPAQHAVAQRVLDRLDVPVDPRTPVGPAQRDAPRRGRHRPGAARPPPGAGRGDPRRGDPRPAPRGAGPLPPAAPHVSSPTAPRCSW